MRVNIDFAHLESDWEKKTYPATFASRLFQLGNMLILLAPVDYPLTNIKVIGTTRTRIQTSGITGKPCLNSTLGSRTRESMHLAN